MDNRTNTIEDAQSTPEHLAGQMGSPGFAKTGDKDLDATPGGLRQSMLDAEHDAGTTTGFSGGSSQQAANTSGGVQSQFGSNDWRTRLSERAQTMRGTASAHPVALALIGIGLGLGIAAIMRSRSGGR